MLMKLAFYDSRGDKDNIAECCTKFHADYVPIFDNKFGILTEDYKIAYGREDWAHASDLNVSAFVDIYKCVQDCESKKKSRFGKKRRTHYSGELLDNLFFKNVMYFCKKHNIELDYLRYVSNFESEDTTTDIGEMMDVFTQLDNFRILKLCLSLQNISIIFGNNGYVDIASDHEFYKRNEGQIIDMIKTGFED